MLGSGGGTRQSERAVAAALNWLARHQSPDGSWSLTAYKARCKDASCTGRGQNRRTLRRRHGLGLLPFLAAGQTHESKGPYKQNIYAGIAYLVKNQKNRRRPADGPGELMYDHGLASIALCECYGMTGDKLVGRAAQAALNFIVEAQDPAGGGWRYEPRMPGDTSVVGWQIMALKSGKMAHLTVNPVVFEQGQSVSEVGFVGHGWKLGVRRHLRLPDPGRYAHPDRGRSVVLPVHGDAADRPRDDRGHGFDLMKNQPDPAAATSTTGTMPPK